MFYSSNTNYVDKQLVLEVLEVRSSNDVERYLGLPNLVGKKKASFQILRDRIKLKIDGWSTRFLS